MTPVTPEQLPVAFAEAFNARDLEGLMSLYTSDAIFAPEPEVIVKGENIRAALQNHLALNAPIILSVKRCLVANNIALLITDWQIEGFDLQGHSVQLSGTTSDVAQRDHDNIWRFLIDNPFGTTL